MRLKLAIAFTNFGPYHLARLRALGARLLRDGGSLVAHEMAGSERLYPWSVARRHESFSGATLFPDRAIEDVPAAQCRAAITEALDRDDPDAVAICGYSRPESMAALRWAERRRRPAILMSESQEIDHPRLWWKETLKARRVRRFSAALVGGPSHREYLASLGIPAKKVALGYNAVDNDAYLEMVEAHRRSPAGRSGLPNRRYFLAVSRLVPEKNLVGLVRAFASYRREVGEETAWDLAVCGGGPGEADLAAAVRESGVDEAVHRPGFLQESELSRWYAYASGFVHPSLLEPWGLVVNEAAASGLPLLVSRRAGCARTLVPDPPGTSGTTFDPTDESAIARALTWLATMPETRRAAMGRRAAEIASSWGPDRFAEGMMEALDLARSAGSGQPKTVSGGSRR